MRGDDAETDGQLRVHFLPLSLEGRIGFTLAPGRRGRDRAGRYWTRDLDEDLDRLEKVLRVDRLVLLLSPEELTAHRIGALPEAARRRGLEVNEAPLAAADPPGSIKARLPSLLEALRRSAEAGETSVLVSGDGLGRAPMVAACVLIREGMSAERALTVIRQLRGPDCLTDPELVAGVRAFAGTPIETTEAPASADRDARPFQHTPQHPSPLPAPLPHSLGDEGLGSDEGPSAGGVPRAGPSIEAPPDDPTRSGSGETLPRWYEVEAVDSGDARAALDLGSSSGSPLRTAGAARVRAVYAQAAAPGGAPDDALGEPERMGAPEAAQVARADLAVPGHSGGAPSEPDRPPGRTPEAAPILVPRPAALAPYESACVGAILGAALGDALGAPLEAERDRAALEARFGPNGPIAPLLSVPPRGGAPIALVSEDTQLAELALETLIEARRRKLELEAFLARLSERLARWATHPRGGHRSPEPSGLSSARRLAEGEAWTEVASNANAGTSGLARAHPFGLAFSDDLRRAEHWAAAQSRVTHRASDAVAAAAALAVGVGRLARGEQLHEALSEMVAAACRISPRTASRLARALHDADIGVPPAVMFERTAEPTAHDALAAALYVVRRHPDDFEGAVREGVITPGDSDAVGAAIGALLGARLGAGALPPSWLAVLERRESLEALALALAASR